MKGFHAYIDHQYSMVLGRKVKFMGRKRWVYVLTRFCRNLLLFAWIFSMKVKVKVLVTQSSWTLCNPMNHTGHQAPLSMKLFRQEYWSGLPCPSAGVLPNPGIKPRSSTLQRDNFPSERPGKPFLNEVRSKIISWRVLMGEKNWRLRRKEKIHNSHLDVRID